MSKKGLDSMITQYMMYVYIFNARGSNEGSTLGPGEARQSFCGLYQGISDQVTQVVAGK